MISQKRRICRECYHLMGQTSGWAYVNYKAYNSGIVLFDGKASKVGDNLWRNFFKWKSKILKKDN